MTSVLRDRGASSPAAVPAPEGHAKHLVRVGHELAEAAILRTRQRVGQGGPPGSGDADSASGAGPRDPLHFAETALRVWAELATGMIRAVFPLVPQLLPDATKIVDALRDLAGGHAKASSGKASSGQTTTGQLAFSVEVQSARPVRISFQLHHETQVAGLAVQPLFPIGKDAGKAPLTGVKLAPGKDGKSVDLHLSVPDGQPPGRYLGAVYDEASGTIAGGLTVDLGG
jgi:hypothetical protein